jgi:hypothetical protein
MGTELLSKGIKYLRSFATTVYRSINNIQCLHQQAKYMALSCLAVGIAPVWERCIYFLGLNTIMKALFNE